MSSVDERIVQMTFDNQQFESGVKESLFSLDKLKSALNFNKEAGNIENLQSASRSFSLDGMGNAVEFVQGKFGALEIMGIRVLQRIADSAYNMGSRMVKALTIDQIKGGFSEYELKMGSIQTIMAGTGESIETVNKYLNELNEYSDRTIYSFSDMTSNIGKFTNAGVSLENSVLAIKGVSNVAALAGANANEASRAMYNFAQALSSGYVKLIDWKSIENANMATKDFKQQLIDTAVAMGTVKKTADGYVTTTTNMQGKVSDVFTTTKGFNDSLAHQWMTTDVLTQTLSNYSVDLEHMSKEEKNAWREKLKSIGYTEEQIKDVEKLNAKAYAAAQDVKTFSQLMDTVKESIGSGWAQTFELIFGNLEEAKALWTDVNNAISGFVSASSDARNDLLQGWKDLGGRDSAIQAFWNAWNGVAEILSRVKEAFREFFPATTAQQLFEFTKNIENLTEKFANLLKVPEGKDWEKMKQVAPPEAIERTKRLKENVENLQKFFRGFFAALDIGKQILIAAFEVVRNIIGQFVPLGEGLLGISGDFGEWLVQLDKFVSETDYFGQIVESLDPIIEAFGDAMETVFGFLKSGLDKIVALFRASGDSFGGFSEAIGEGVNPVAAFIDSLVRVFTKLKNIAVEVYNKGLKPLIDAIGDGLGKAFDTLVGNLSKGNGAKNLLDILNGGLFAGLLLGQDRFKKFIEKLTGLNLGSVLGDLKSEIGSFVDMIVDKFTNAQKMDISDTILKIAGAIAIFAVGLVLLSSIDTNALVASVAAIGAVVFIFVKAKQTLDKSVKATASLKDRFSNFIGGLLDSFNPKKTIDNVNLIMMATALLEIAGAVAILAGAVLKLAGLKLEQLAIGLGGVLVLIVAMMGVAKYLSKMEKGVAKGLRGLKAVAAAVATLSNVVVVLGGLNVKQLIKGIVAVGALILELGVFTKIADDMKLSTAAGIILIAFALKMLVKTVQGLGDMEAESLGRGLVGVAGILGGLALFSHIVNPKHILKISASMVIMSGAIIVIAAAMKLLSTIDPKTMTLVAVSLALFIGAIAIMVNLMNGAMGGATALFIVSAAMVALSGALILLSTMPTDKLIGTLLALAGAIGILVIAANLLAPALQKIGLGTLAIGLGIMAMAAAFAILDSIIAAGKASMVSSLTLIVESLLQVISVLAPKIIQTGIQLIHFLLDAIQANLPAFIQKGVNIVVMLILGLAQALPVLINAGVLLIVSFINSLADAIYNNTDVILGAIKNLCGAVINLIISTLQEIVEMIPGIGGLLSDGLESAKSWVKDNFSSDMSQATSASIDTAMGNAQSSMTSNTDGLKSATESTMTAGILDPMSEIGDQVAELGVDIPDDYAAAISGNTGAVAASTGEIKDTVVDGLNEVPNETPNIGKNGIQGFLNGAESMRSSISQKAVSLANTFNNSFRSTLKIESPSKVMMEAGRFIGLGLVKGIDNSSNKVEESARSMGGSVMDGMHSVISTIKNMIDSDLDLMPTIRPVVDVSGIQNGMSSINGMYNGYSMNLAGSIGSINLSQGQIFDDLNKRLDSRFEELSDRIDRISDRPFVANLTTTLDGREIARGTATYTNEEMNRITRNNNRKAGRRG